MTQRNTIIALIFWTFSALSSAAGAAETAAFLSKAETAEVLRSIDDICADSWCAGDLNFHFPSLQCNRLDCSLDIQFEARNDSQTRPQDLRNYRCSLKGFASKEDLAKIAPIFDGSLKSSYSEKLYDAVGSCIRDEIQPKFPLMVLPKASSCLGSLLKKSYYNSDSHSVFADIFYEVSDPKEAAAQTLTLMVEAYAQTDATCRNEVFVAFKDSLVCDQLNGQGKVCVLPSDIGRFVVLKDGVDGAAVIYLKNRAQKNSLGSLSSRVVSTKVAQSPACYSDLLNLNNNQEAQSPYASSDHRSFFASTKGLNFGKDARLNAVQLINNTVGALNQKFKSTCSLEKATQNISKEVCRNLGEVDMCSIAGQNSGYFIVTKDYADGAFVTFMRYD